MKCPYEKIECAYLEDGVHVCTYCSHYNKVKDLPTPQVSRTTRLVLCITFLMMLIITFIIAFNHQYLIVLAICILLFIFNAKWMEKLIFGEDGKS
jgi:hypothetical protein